MEEPFYVENIYEYSSDQVQHLSNDALIKIRNNDGSALPLTGVKCSRVYADHYCALMNEAYKLGFNEGKKSQK